MTNWMTAAGIALIAGGLATLIGFRHVLWGGGHRRRSRAPRALEAPQRAALPAAPNRLAVSGARSGGRPSHPPAAGLTTGDPAGRGLTTGDQGGRRLPADRRPGRGQSTGDQAGRRFVAGGEVERGLSTGDQAGRGPVSEGQGGRGLTTGDQAGRRAAAEDQVGQDVAVGADASHDLAAVPHQPDPLGAPEVGELSDQPVRSGRGGRRKPRRSLIASGTGEIRDDTDVSGQLDLGLPPVERDGGLAALGLADEEPEDEAELHDDAAAGDEPPAGTWTADEAEAAAEARTTEEAETWAPDEAETWAADEAETWAADEAETWAADKAEPVTGTWAGTGDEMGADDDEPSAVLRLATGDQPAADSWADDEPPAETWAVTGDDLADAEDGAEADGGEGADRQALTASRAARTARSRSGRSRAGRRAVQRVTTTPTTNATDDAGTGADDGLASGHWDAIDDDVAPAGARFEMDSGPISRRDTQPLDRRTDDRFAPVDSRFGDPRYGDRVAGWVRPHYQDEADEEVSGEYWTPVRISGYGDEEPGYGWPVPVERLAPVQSRFDPAGDEAEPTAVVPQWPPARPSGRIELPRSWAERNQKEPAADEDPQRRRGVLARRTARTDRRRGAATEFLPAVGDSTEMLPPVPEPPRNRPRPRPRPSQPDTRSTVYRSRHAADPT